MELIILPHTDFFNSFKTKQNNLQNKIIISFGMKNEPFFINHLIYKNYMSKSQTANSRILKASKIYVLIVS